MGNQSESWTRLSVQGPSFSGLGDVRSLPRRWGWFPVNRQTWGGVRIAPFLLGTFPYALLWLIRFQGRFTWSRATRPLTRSSARKLSGRSASLTSNGLPPWTIGGAISRQELLPRTIETASNKCKLLIYSVSISEEG